MKAYLHFVLAGAALLSLVPSALSQTAKRPAKTAPAAPPRVADSNLEAVLTQMDRAAATFRYAQADFVWDQYQMVVEETDTQKGVIYFRRKGKDTDMAADVKKPESKYVLFADGKLSLYQPRIDQVTEYDVAKKRAEVESFLVLGFGGRGHDLLRAFKVKLLNRETIDGVNTAVLELTPTAPNVHNMFSRMVLWIDPARGISLKQQFFEPSGDYRLARYLNINLNQKVPDDVFKLKTTPSTKTVSPQA
jgi:outer membrane lipoprotein-sorting protein